jgi:hypothetical protein
MSLETAIRLLIGVVVFLIVVYVLMRVLEKFL